MFSSRPIFINILASFDPLHRSRCPHRSLFESRNLLKILIKLDLEKKFKSVQFMSLNYVIKHIKSLQNLVAFKLFYNFAVEQYKIISVLTVVCLDGSTR